VRCLDVVCPMIFCLPLIKRRIKRSNRVSRYISLTLSHILQHFAVMAPKTPSRDKSVVIARKTVPRRSGEYNITRTAAPGARVQKSHLDLRTRTANIHQPSLHQMSNQRPATTGAPNGPTQPAPRNTPATQTPPGSPPLTPPSPHRLPQNTH